MNAMVEANLVEIFSSFQGEGPHVGCSTLFVRFGACDLRCRWCDSPHTWKAGPRCRIEDPARGEREVDNPYRSRRSPRRRTRFTWSGTGS
jgi:organic radical activating enzyme